jgi:arsenate reductase
MSQPKRVLFLCTGNSARSQMAEALLERIGGDAFGVSSAGTNPKELNPYTIRVLGELGIDWSAAESKSLQGFLDQSFEYVVTVCDHARQVCPVFPGGGTRLHWDLEDPAEATGTDEQRLAAFRATRDDLTARVTAFVQSVRAGDPFAAA